MSKSFETAVKCLNSRKQRAKASLEDMRGSDDMVNWLRLVGHSVDNLQGLNPIHVAGTNGKGSTCTFIASFLIAHGQRTGRPAKVGLYISPHMLTIRERICINGQYISEENFAERFFEVWDKLPLEATPELDIPRYLQLLALLAFHVFIEEKVDAAIFETHCGGEYDATNIIKAPVVTAITPVQVDHERLLGPGIENIAWHKAGIFKPGSLAFSAVQDLAVSTILKKRAQEKDVSLQFVDIDTAFPAHECLKPVPQRANCSLALAVVRAWLTVMSCGALIADDIKIGLELFNCPGRFQRLHRGETYWFLDGAHNESSLRATVDWFKAIIAEEAAPTRVLIFSHFSARDGLALIHSFAAYLKLHDIWFQHIICCSYTTTSNTTRLDRNCQNSFSLDMQQTYLETWRRLQPQAEFWAERNIEDALKRVMNSEGTRKQVLVTGSLHLVSGAAELLWA